MCIRDRYVPEPVELLRVARCRLGRTGQLISIDWIHRQLHDYVMMRRLELDDLREIYRSAGWHLVGAQTARRGREAAMLVITYARPA